MKAVIVDWLRSPFHRAHKGKLANVRPDELAGQVIRELMKKNNISGSMIDDLILGCAYPEGEQGYNMGRLLTFLGDLPNHVFDFRIDFLQLLLGSIDLEGNGHSILGGRSNFFISRFGIGDNAAAE